MILQAAVTHTFKHQRCLYGRIAEHTRRPIESLTVLMQSFQEEICVVEARQRKTRQGILHVAVEVPAVLLFQSLRRSRQGIIIEVRRDIGIVFIKVLQMGTGIHQPFGIAEY